MQIDFDPALISYEQLLAEFLVAHNPAAVPFSRQYASMIHYHDEAQLAAAQEALADYAVRTGKTARTTLAPLGVFTWAEDYHQKYNLRQVHEVEAGFEAIYPDGNDLANSTAAMRINAYVGGYLSDEELRAQAPELGLSPQALEALVGPAGVWSR